MLRLAKIQNPTDSMVAVKDGLRRARYEIRRRARGSRETDALSSLLPRPLAHAADAVFSAVESAALGFRAPEHRKSGNLTFPRSLGAYFQAFGATAEDEDAFANELYYATKSLLRHFGAEDFLVSERAFESVRERMNVGRPSHSANRLSEIDICEFCAALAVEIATVRPIRRVAFGAGVRPRNLMLSPNAYCAFVIALAVALVTRDTNGEANKILSSADLTVDACFGELTRALRAREPAPALAKEFRVLLPHLP